jgi:dTDP-4-amino-4,6-dideoxygalactose transaminase
MQAAVLRARLPFLRAWTSRRRALAGGYRKALAGGRVRLLREFDAGHVYHLFVIRSARRDELQRHLAHRGIDSLVHYPIPIPEQPALAGTTPARCPEAAKACNEVLSLPLHPGLSDVEVSDVASAILEFKEP